MRVGRMSDALEARFRPWRVGAQLFGAFGMLALLITAVGVYGVMAYSVSRRTHEMGVRMALGARLRDVATPVLREGLRILVLGVVLGIAATLALGSLVESFLYGVTSRDAVSTAGAVVVVLAAGAAANLIPTWRDTRRSVRSAPAGLRRGAGVPAGTPHPPATSSHPPHPAGGLLGPLADRSRASRGP